MRLVSDPKHTGFSLGRTVVGDGSWINQRTSSKEHYWMIKSVHTVATIASSMRSRGRVHRRLRRIWLSCVISFKRTASMDESLKSQKILDFRSRKRCILKGHTKLQADPRSWWAADQATTGSRCLSPCLALRRPGYQPLSPWVLVNKVDIQMSDGGSVSLDSEIFSKVKNKLLKRGNHEAYFFTNGRCGGALGGNERAGPSPFSSPVFPWFIHTERSSSKSRTSNATILCRVLAATGLVESLKKNCHVPRLAQKLACKCLIWNGRFVAFG